MNEYISHSLLDRTPIQIRLRCATRNSTINESAGYRSETLYEPEIFVPNHHHRRRRHPDQISVERAHSASGPHYKVSSEMHVVNVKRSKKIETSSS